MLRLGGIPVPPAHCAARGSPVVCSNESMKSETSWPHTTYLWTMPETLSVNSMPSVFSPLAKALLDAFSEGVVVFDVEGRLLYANQPAREALSGFDLSEHAPDLMP